MVERRGMAPRLLLLASLASTLLVPTLSYNVADGPTRTEAFHDARFPASHGVITRAGIALLTADKQPEAAALFAGSRGAEGCGVDDHLMDGLRQADLAAEDFLVQMYGTGGRVPRNSLAHFYNPLTKEGFQFPMPKMDGMTLTPDPHTMLRARWEVSIMGGPFAPATELIEWEYSQAVAHMRAGSKEQALTALGRALHVLQDLTVPHHVTDKPSGVGNYHHQEYEDMVEQLLFNVTKGTSPDMHPKSGGIYCDTCPPTEFAVTAANQSARFIGAAMQPASPQASAVAGVMLGAADKLSAGLLSRFYRRWQDEQFTTVKLSVERVKVLYKYRKKGDEGEHYMLGKGRNRQADVTVVVVQGGEQRRSSTARNCNDVRPKQLVGGIDILEKNYLDNNNIMDCKMVYKAADPLANSTLLQYGWNFVNRVNLGAGAPNGGKLQYQIVVLDDLIPGEDQRVDVAPGEERKNLVFEYDPRTDEILGVDPGAWTKLGRGEHMLRSKGDKASPRAAALTVKLTAMPLYMKPEAAKPKGEL